MESGGVSCLNSQEEDRLTADAGKLKMPEGGLHPGNYSGSGMEGIEAKHGVRDPLDEAVVL